MAPSSINEDDLQAYVDGALAPDRQREVEAHLADDPDAGERLAAYRDQIGLLHALYDPVLDERVPARLRPARAGREGHWIGRGIAASLLLLLGGVVGWWTRGVDHVTPPSPEQTFARQAVAAHAVFTPEVRHPVEVGAEAEEHLVTWLSKRLKAELRAPVLTASGFDLVGGRLLSERAGPAALFMYEDGTGRRLTLYVRRRVAPMDETAFRYMHEDDIGVFYWIDSQLSYAIAGQMEKDALLALSRAIYGQLDR
ncbi:MAG: anti-sigma factor [Alphaproteobacteria bacterium]|jgi:anti-sigma factor RsiW|nr:anti-sigma factor [Alphaproteobacteria bacterium]